MQAQCVTQRAGAFPPARPCQQRVARAPAAARLGGAKTAKGKEPGFRFDGSMQRWVRDDRYVGKSLTTVTPKSGGTYTVWPVMWSYLVDKKLRQVDEKQAQALAAKGAVIVDVRMAEDYTEEHIAGAISVPMYRRTAGTQVWDNVKKFVMASLAMRATERDPDFIANMEKAIGNKRKKVVVACAMGGTLDTIVRVASTGKSASDPDRAFGRETRSLKACYEMMNAGFNDIVHLKGGLSNWRYNGFPVEGRST